MAGRKLNQRSKRNVNLRNFYSFRASFLCVLACLICCSNIVRADDIDFGPYMRAVEYCRGNVKRPFAFDLDQRVLCFDGALTSDLDISLAKGLRQSGLFVARSGGGAMSVAAGLADILRDQHATVVVYDYCFSACASYLLLASQEAVVLRNTVVAWHHPIDPYWCPLLEVTKEDNPKRLEKSPCPDAPPEIQQSGEYRRYLNSTFYAGRVIDPQFEDPPESFTIRKILKGMFEGTGRYPDVLWTWNPRYYASTLKTKIVYEAYPQSQEEVDALVARFHTSRVIYDP